jgi:hypothetical protein
LTRKGEIGERNEILTVLKDILSRERREVANRDMTPVIILSMLFRTQKKTAVSTQEAWN